MAVALRALALSSLALCLGGCATLNYLAMSASGHFDLLAKRRPIETVLSDPSTPDKVRAKLEQVQELLDFADHTLDLPSGGSYRTYVDISRPFVTWTVVVTPALSTRPKQWCFPVVGCVAYRGYFDAVQAQEFASTFDELAFDTYVGGASAYSTLGWFDDPVLSTMLKHGESHLAAVIFHELAHQRLYVADDSTFNESYAVAVERIGVRRWFESTARPQALAAYNHAVARRQAFLEIVVRVRQKLSKLYASELPDADKRIGKERLFEQLRAEHSVLREQWGGKSPYDGWFKSPLNNARLALVATYSEYVPALLDLFEQSTDMRDFQLHCENLAMLDRALRRRKLARD